MTDTTSDRNPVDVLADEFAARLRDGADPSIGEYVARHPHLADEIRATFPSIAMMEKLSRKEHTERKFDRQTSRLAGHATETLGDFQIVREIGRGGMGVVYEAVEKSLKRRVALKVLGPNIAGSPKQIQRFIREAEAAARLHHTNIVPVYGIGEENDLHFFAMQFIDGVPLSDVIHSVSGRPANRSASTASACGSLADRLLAPVTDGESLLNNQNDDEPGNLTRQFNAARAARALLSGTLKDRPLMTEGDSSSGQVADGDFPGPDTTGSDTIGSDTTDESRQRRADPSTIESCSALTGIENKLPEISTRYWRSIARIGSEIADALHYSHQHGVLHRDIKPSNLLLDHQGVVWVTDFGLARHEDQDGITNTGDIVGTLRYMAPEQFNGDSNTRSDIYSLGLTLYELLTLRPAFEESRHGPLIAQKTNSMPPAPRSINAAIPRDLETITQKACATNPADRYATAGELANDLRRFLEDRPVLARRATVAEQFLRWSRRNPVVATLSGATVTLLATVAVVFAVGQYRTAAALEIVEQQKTQLEQRQTQLDQSLIAERKASQTGREEYARAEKNLQLAVTAFDSIIKNVASRGMPQSLTLSLGDEEPRDGEPHFYDTVLTAADADLLEALLKFFDDFASQNPTDLRAQSANARKRVGDIQQRLGRFEEAEATYRQSLAAFETLSRQNPKDLQLVIAQARIQNEIAIAASRRGAMWGAVNEHNRAKQLLQETDGVMDTASGKLELARTLGLLTTIGSRSGMSALMSLARNDSPDGKPFPNGRAVSDGRSRGDGRRDNGRQPGDRSENDQKTDNRPDGNGVNDNQSGGGRSSAERRSPGPGGNPRGSLRSWNEIFLKTSDQSLALLNELLADEPSRPEYRLALAVAWRNRVTVARFINDAQMGSEAITTAIQHLEELARDFPDDPVYRFELADTLCLRATRNDDNDPTAEQLQRVNRAIVLCEDLIENYPNVTEYQALMGTSLSRMGILLQRQESYGLAADCFHQALDFQQSLAERFSTVSLYQIAYLQTLWGLSEISAAQQNSVGAVGYLDAAIERLQFLTSAAPGNRMLDRYLEKLRRRRHEMAQPSSSANPPA
ncbi:MAG: protein kinase [Rhodopirellula sp.]|nr:protein kinase [Rhodopirellula sp.]